MHNAAYRLSEKWYEPGDQTPHTNELCATSAGCRGVPGLCIFLFAPELLPVT